MRTVMFKFGGTATGGDQIWLNTRHPVRGGRSSVKVTVRGYNCVTTIVNDGTGERIEKQETPAWGLADIVSEFARVINSQGPECEWLPGTGDFRAVADGDILMVMASDLVSEHTYDYEVVGAGTEQIEVKVL